MMTDLDDYDLMRRLSYQGTNLFLFTISADHASTITDVRERWIKTVYSCHGHPEARKSILVCLNDHCRTDPEALKELRKLSGEKNAELVDNNDAARLAEELDALAYLTCEGTSRPADIHQMVMEVRCPILESCA